MTWIWPPNSRNEKYPPVDRPLLIGETEWAKSGRFTGVTNIDLTAKGVAQVSSAASTLVGAGKYVDPANIKHAFVSPRLRATRTFELLFSSPDQLEGSVTYTEDIAEWNYGHYEGLTQGEVEKLREDKGLDARWNIWSDGCEGGECVASKPCSSIRIG